MILVLLRHGKTEANEKRLYCGKTDIGLSDGGIRELETKRREAPPFDISGMRIVTSGMRRCSETLSILFGDRKFETDPDFCEMDFGAFEMRSFEELKNDPGYLLWISGDNEKNEAPDGESGEIMASRVMRGLERLVTDGRDTLLVTHGGVIAAVMERLFPDERKNRYEWQPDCGEGYIVDLANKTYARFP